MVKHIALLTVLVAGTTAAQAASVDGVVTVERKPVVNARVTLFTPQLEAFYETRTLNDGGYSIDRIAPGKYHLGVAAIGYEYEQIGVNLGAEPVVADFSLEVESHPGTWEVVGSTAPELFDATDIGVLLTDGTVLYCHDTVDPIRFDPATGNTVQAGGSPVEQGCMNATLLADGDVIMMGGQTPSDPGAFTNAIPWVKHYSPGSDSWQFMASMQHRAGRWYPGLARLADGSLLVMGGGQAPNAQRTDTCERFDLASQTWSYTGSMLNPTEFPPCALLYTGEVLATWWPPQLYNPATAEWRLTGNFVQPNRGWPGHSDHSLIVLSDGRALATGVLGTPNPNTAMGEIYDPATEQWTPTSNPGLIRFQSEVVQLPDGHVLVAGGETDVNPPPVPHVLGVVKWCDLYNPSADSWRRVADTLYFREYHAVTLLVPDGRVLSTGGTRIKFQYGPITSDIEAYSPPYLFRGVRPQLVTVSTVEPSRGCAIELQLAPLIQITSVVLIGAQTTTHWVDGGNPRRLVLPVKQEGDTVYTTLPADPNLLPLGHYMLFAMVDDIPSVAWMVNVHPLLGELNGDGDVDAADLALLLGSWGPCDPCPADLDSDGAVGAADLAQLLGSWGPCD